MILAPQWGQQNETPMKQLENCSRAIPMKNRFHLALLLHMALIRVFLAVGTAHAAERPVDLQDPMQVISAYLRATYARDFAEAYRYVSNEDRKIRDAVLKDGGLERFRISCGAFLDLPDLITELAEKADAIVIVSFVSKSSQITSDGTDIFTDYDLHTEQILKDANPGALKRDEIITVTRPGGKVLLYGRIAWIFNTAYESLMAGRHYLLFLRYIPATGAYQAVDHASSFDITEARVRTLSSAALRPYPTDPGEFIASVKLAIANNQQKGRTQ